MEKLHNLYKALGEQLMLVEAKANMTRYIIIGLDHEVLCRGTVGDLAEALPLPEGWFYEQHTGAQGRMVVSKRKLFGEPVLVGYCYAV